VYSVRSTTVMLCWWRVQYAERIIDTNVGKCTPFQTIVSLRHCIQYPRMI